MSLLIIDDDIELCGMLQAYLATEGLDSIIESDAQAGFEAIIGGDFDLVILDVMLPVLDGFSLLRRLRERSSIPVIMLTAHANVEDRIVGFEAGADDYVTKPFTPGELLGRINAILRRAAAKNSDRSNAQRKAESDYNGIRLDYSAREAYCRGLKLQLTDTELVLLKMFIESPGIVISREELFVRVFKREFHPLDRSLDMHISRLRKKLELSGCLADAIRTVRNSGYMLAEGQVGVRLSSKHTVN